MLTAVVSDLHLGTPTSLLATAEGWERLLPRLEDVNQLVLLGDVLALRRRPLDEVLHAAAPFFDELGDVLAGKRVVIVPGNHDHHLAAGLLEERRLRGAHALGLELTGTPSPGGPAAWIAGRMPATDVVLAYPGLWLRPDVYATHGHYVDLHMTFPRLECLVAGAMRRLGDVSAAGPATPADYERVLSPFYAFLHSAAQYRGEEDARAAGGAGGLWRRVRARGWRQLEADAERARLERRFPPRLLASLGVTALRLAGVGDFNPDLSPAELDRAGVRAMRELVQRLRLDADHVILGHTHRAGPRPGEAAWTVGGRTSIVNAGAWAYAPELVGRDGPGSVFWPGTCVLVRAVGPPELRSLVGELPAHLAALGP